MPKKTHLIGSIGLENAETAMTQAAKILGRCCTRIPDGETGERGYWIRWQQDTFDNCADLEMAVIDQKLPGFKDSVRRPFYRIKQGVKPGNLNMGELGYAEEAINSYKIFSKCVEEGKIIAGVRFQVSVPTPMALICGFVLGPDQLKVEPAIEQAMARDIARIQSEIPLDSLSFQWDVCFEVVGHDGGPKLPYDNSLEGSVERVGRLCGLLDDKVELIIHLCYGDPGHKHIVDPADLGTSVAFANGICAASSRRIDAIHMPVVRGRADDAYFKPLENLNMPRETRLILGLVHHTDGVEGGKARMASADRYVNDYDIATECGFGRRDPATIPDLLQIHRDLCT